MKISPEIKLVQFQGNPRVYVLWTDQLYVMFNIKEEHIRLGESGGVASMHGLTPVTPDTIIDGNGRVAPNGGIYKASDLVTRLTNGLATLADPFAWKEYKTDWMVQPNLYSGGLLGGGKPGKPKGNRFVLLNV